MATEMGPLTRGAREDCSRRLAGRVRRVLFEKPVTSVVEDCYELIGDRPTVGPNLMPTAIERFDQEVPWPGSR